MLHKSYADVESSLSDFDDENEKRDELEDQEEEEEENEEVEGNKHQKWKNDIYSRQTGYKASPTKGIHHMLLTKAPLGRKVPSW